ncbi:MAG: hypothetical protein KGJ97_11840, partial [Xanthomonadaceae bacterium]|nr:hypothetical protein [Xanthomonadaceae bacterium]
MKAGIAAAVGVAIGLAAVGTVHATTTRTPEVTPATQHDTLPSLRGVMPRPDDFIKNSHAYPAHPLPFLSAPGNQADGALQTAASGSFAPALGAGFDGVGQGFSGPQGTFTVNSAPPDTNGAVGATQYLQIVNSAFAVFDKSSKAVVYGPVPTNTLWKG